ncbi:MAG: hypothetical protein FJ095_09650 [Deltaproteobacteria bacterium]|nr:hypothetical protein [Deltaproteobacteria bacterium]
MLYAVKPPAASPRPSQLVREPSPEGGHDAEDMRLVLRNALRTFTSTPLQAPQLRSYAEYLESMAYAGPTRWFDAPSRLAWAWRDYFELADRVERQLTLRPEEHDADQVRRVLVSAMTLLTSRVLAFATQEARANPKAVTVPLVATASRASSRTRRWCSDDEPGKAQMLGVLSYSVIDVASQAVERLTHDDSCTAELVQETSRALDEVLATLRQLAGHHAPDACFDDADEGANAQPSRAVRALRGLAWSHDVLGQAGVAPRQGQVEDMLGLLETMWQSAQGRPHELPTLIGSAAHLTSTWATLVDSGTVKTVTPATRSLWLARQASVRAGDDLGLAKTLLEVAQAAAAVAGLAIQRGVGNGIGLAAHTADLVETVVRRTSGRLSGETFFEPVANLTMVAADARDRGLPQSAELFDRIAGLNVVTRR